MWGPGFYACLAANAADQKWVVVSGERRAHREPGAVDVGINDDRSPARPLGQLRSRPLSTVVWFVCGVDTPTFFPVWVRDLCLRYSFVKQMEPAFVIRCEIAI